MGTTSVPNITLRGLQGRPFHDRGRRRVWAARRRPCLVAAVVVGAFPGRGGTDILGPRVDGLPDHVATSIEDETWRVRFSDRSWAAALALVGLVGGSVAADDPGAFGGTLPTDAKGIPLNLDFETGTLKDWTAEGDAFAGQPIKGDTVAPRRRT